MSKNKVRSQTMLLKNELVPKELYPYKVPDNWVYFYFTSLLDVTGGTQPPKSEFIDEPQEGYTRLIQIRDFSSDKYATYIPNKKNLRLINEDDIVIARYGASLGRILTGLSGAINVALAKLSFSDEIFDRKFLYYLLQTQHFQGPLLKLSRSAQNGFNKNDLSYFPIPLPPLNEQQRIANKVGRLLDKINQAKQLIEEAKETFELRRAAILDKAFRGELTKKWREEYQSLGTDMNSLGYPDGWTLRNFDFIAADEKYALGIGPFGSNLKVADYTNDGVKLIFVRSIRNSDYFTDCKYVSTEKAKDLQAHLVTSGDLLITKMGDPPGDVDICPQHIDKAVITADVIKVRVNKDKAINKFIMYAIKSSFVQKQIRKQTKGVAQQKINLKTFREMVVPIPSIEEQQVIVEQLDLFFNLENETLERLDTLENYLSQLQQSILSSAFRGELGTNVPEENHEFNVLLN